MVLSGPILKHFSRVFNIIEFGGNWKNNIDKRNKSYFLINY